MKIFELDLEVVAYQMLMAGDYDELTKLLKALPDGDYPPLVSMLRRMTTMSPAQLRLLSADD